MTQVMNLFVLLSTFILTQAAPYYDSYGNNQDNAFYSEILRVSDISPNGTIQKPYGSNVLIYASSSQSLQAIAYERNIMITIENITKSFSEISNLTNSNHTKSPMTDMGVMNVTITNNNPVLPDYDNVGFLYFVTADDKNHKSTVVDAPQNGWTYKLEADNVNEEYITVLSPIGAIALSQFDGVNGLTMLSLSVGGLKEATNDSYNLIDLSKWTAKTNASLVVLEPLITLHKSLAVQHSSFTFRAQGRNVSNVQVDMGWGDVSIAMSPNYRLKGKTTSLNYTFNAAQADSKFSVQVYGDINERSSLTLQYSGNKGNGIEQVSKTLDMSGKYFSMDGNMLSVQYFTNDTQLQDNGYYAVIECKQFAFTNFSLSFITLMSIVAMAFKN